MKMRKVQLQQEIRLPGANPGIATSTGSFFTEDAGFEIDYDPATQLVTIAKNGDRRCVHASRVVEMDPGPLPKPAVKVVPGKPAPKES